MNFAEEAKIRIEHWIHHNLDLLEDYEVFAAELETAGKSESARHIREMGRLLSRSNDHLKEALRYLVADSDCIFSKRFHGFFFFKPLRANAKLSGLV